MNTLARLILLVTLAAACGAPAIRPAYKTDVDTRLAAQASRRELGPTSLEPRPWKVGQWALYRTMDDGKLGYERWSIVGEDECGVWVETVTQDYYHRSITKACYARMPWLPDSRGMIVADVIDLVQVMHTRSDDGETQTFDLRENPAMKQNMKMFASAFVSFQWANNDALPRQNVDVPAGRFSGAAAFPLTVTVFWKSITVTTLVHAEVPVYGVVRSTASTGRTSELVDFGDSGAVSML
ncbi:MAG TPA: hypothetical protein VIU61_04720 [Kofleriaceae bacterium]